MRAMIEDMRAMRSECIRIGNLDCADQIDRARLRAEDRRQRGTLKAVSIEWMRAAGYLRQAEIQEYGSCRVQAHGT